MAVETIRYDLDSFPFHHRREARTVMVQNLTQLAPTWDIMYNGN